MKFHFWHRVFASVFGVAALGLVVWMFPAQLWWIYQGLLHTQNGAIVIGVLTGLFSSFAATLLYSRVQKETWQRDIVPLKDEVAGIRRAVTDATVALGRIRDDADAIKGDLSAQLAAVRQDHDALLKGLVPAIGGSFTKSLFAFHPMSSEQIARILSVETDRLYRRHHKRVIVTKAKDTYAIKGVKRLAGDPKPVWWLEFHVMWEWLNDSKVTKHPLDDFLLIAVANEEALNDFAYQSEADRVAQHERLAEFLRDRENIVRSTIENPLDDGKQIPAGLMSEVFTIRRIDISQDEVSHSLEFKDLRRIPSTELPVGVYSAFSLPPLNLPLPVGGRLVVEYVGQICLSADAVADGQYFGFMGFPPSDVIGNQYDLTLLYPPEVSLDGKTIALDVVAERSGCQFIHGPLLNQPTLPNRTPAMSRRG